MTPLSRSSHFPELNGLSYTLRRVIDRSIVGGIRSIRSSKSGREKPLISINGSEHFFPLPLPPPEKMDVKIGRENEGTNAEIGEKGIIWCGFQRKFRSATRKVNRRDPVVRFYRPIISDWHRAKTRKTFFPRVIRSTMSSGSIRFE